MTTRQALILFAGVILVAAFIVIAVIDPGCAYYREGWGCMAGRDVGRDARGTSWRPFMYILAGVTAAAAVILAFTPWARRKD